MDDFEKYTQSQKNTEIDKAQSEAIRAKKLGESLVSQVIKMAETGKEKDEARGFTHFMQKNGLNDINYKSTTMALNAELKTEKPGAEATLYKITDDVDGGTASMVRLDKIDGQEVRSKSS